MPRHRSQVTFTEDGDLEATAQNADILAEAVTAALVYRKRVFFFGYSFIACLGGALIAIAAQIGGRYTGWAALLVGAAIGLTFWIGAVAGYSFTSDAVRVEYQPVMKE